MDLFHIKEHTLPAQHVREFPRATANSQEDQLYVAVKQYIPKDNPSPRPGDVTIIGTHANGFPKELYEALWAELHAAARRHGFRIRGIWTADVSNQGASGVLNELTMGDDPSWHDHARDLLHMTNVFRKEMPRPLVGVGHSFGANILCHLALIHPRLFATLVFFDPTITRFSFQPRGAGAGPARSSAARRDLWPSRDAAAHAFRASRFMKAWDPRVLQAWIDHGLRPVPTALFPDAPPGQVTLRTTKHQEVFTFFRPLWPYQKPDGTLDVRAVPGFDPESHDDTVRLDQMPFPFYRFEGPHILRRLPDVRPSVLWVFGGESDLSVPEARKEKLNLCGSGPYGSGGQEAGRVEGIVMEGRGHLFPMEVPAECAEHTAKWIEKEMGRFREEQREYEEWIRKPFREKTTMSGVFMDKLNIDKPARPAKL